MKIIKITNPNINGDIQDKDDDFFTQSHGMIGSEYTLCGVACEEWAYSNYVEVKKINCKSCLDIINECKTYKS